MKFLKKAVKKVFKPIKKFAKSKLGKIALTVGATFFTAGLGTVGFGAFKGAQGVAGILGAVGKTTAAGAQGLLGALGIGSGLSQNLAGQITGAQAGQTLLGLGQNIVPVATGGMPGSPEHIRNMAGAALSQVPQQSNLLRGVGGMFNGYGGLMLARGVMGGVQAYFQNEQWEQQQEMINRRNWFGDRARGGGTTGAPLINFEGTGPLERLPNYASADQTDEDLIRDPNVEPTPEVEIDPLSRRRNLIGIG